MDTEWVRQHLPQKMPDKILRYVKKAYPQELGGNLLIWKAVRTTAAPSLYEIMEDNRTTRHSVWAAEVTCTACGDTFLTAGGRNSFWIANGEDGLSYTVEPETGQEEADVFCDRIEIGMYDQACCPYCQSPGTAMHARHIRGGRTKRIMVESVERIGDYAAIVLWMIENNIQEYGSWCAGYPAWAYVLTERGGLKKYARAYRNMYGVVTEQDCWQLKDDSKDATDSTYMDWGSINNKKRGTVVYPELPDLVGSTGEKTGLEAIVNAEGTEYWIQYLKLWRRWRGVEVLVKAGFTDLVVDAINSYGDTLAMIQGVVNTNERKPHKMLGITKAELRDHGKGIWNWSISSWRTYRAVQQKQPMPLAEYLRLKEWYHGRILPAADLGDPLDKTKRYLEKQSLNAAYIDQLADVRRMVRELYNREPTGEEMWPKNLVAFHEDINARMQAIRVAAKAEMYAAGFREVKERFGALEWTDGDLVMLLPMSNGDLIREGEILRHCVGGYGERHIKGSDTIFFVRHRRRPERPFYTLDIRMDTLAPYEVQLHGYGNERHGPHKEHSHKIPRKVRSFCDRWKKEVLQPYAEQLREQAKNEKKEKTA